MPDCDQRRNDPPPASLGALRTNLDALDDHILDLVERRLAASAAIASLKEAEGRGLLKMRPAREAAVIARLKAKARHAPADLVEQLWRALMSYGLHAQVPTEFCLCAKGDRATLQEQVRARFGTAGSLCWASSPDEAIAAARDREVVAVIEHGLPFRLEEGDKLVMFDSLHDREGRVVAVAIGRVAREEVETGR